jgi:hypothetical protein
VLACVQPDESFDIIAEIDEFPCFLDHIQRNSLHYVRLFLAVEGFTNRNPVCLRKNKVIVHNSQLFRSQSFNRVKFSSPQRGVNPED